MATGHLERTGQMAKYPKNRFAAFVDDDDDDDHEGGVLLRDFEDDYPFGSTSTPMGTVSSKSSGNTRFTDPRVKAATAALANMTMATAPRRNTIQQPIGTGRYSEHAKEATGGALLNPSLLAKDVKGGAPVNPSIDAFVNASVNAWNAQVTDNGVEKTSEPVGRVGKFSATGSFAHAGFKPDMYAQLSPTPGAHVDYSHVLDAVANMAATPSGYGGALKYPSTSKAMGYRYGWGATPSSSGLPASTLQTFGDGGALGGILGSNSPLLESDTTPSQMPKKATEQTMDADTPQMASAYGPYNQTEPRNFAPRGPLAIPPPPAFNIGRQPTRNHDGYDGSRFTGVEFDPFLSPPTLGPNAYGAYGNAQALMLASVPEDAQLGMISRYSFLDQVPSEVRAMRSDQLNKLTEGPRNVPSQEVGLDSHNFPFMESATQAAPVGHGVVKIKNIPFGTKRAEIIAFLGRNSKILNDIQEPVHIIMERVSSKTQDCYVEFMTSQDAVRAVDRHRESGQNGRPCRLGDRPVEVLLSSQAALMQDLFPLASGVWWDNGKPVIQAPVEGEPWKTFKGFVTDEEMTMLVKHVEIPQRSPYSKECPQRPYECMISTLKKLPWYMADRITLRQRHSIYEATVKLIALLKQALARENRTHETVINPQLMKRLVMAAMLCPGFSVVQKDNIAAMAELDQTRTKAFNQPRFAEQWVHLHAICPKPNIPVDVLEWYIAIIREETTRYIHSKHIVERTEIQRTSDYTSLYFGYLWYEIDLPTGKELDNITLHTVARREMAVIERALRRAFPATQRGMLIH